MSSKKASLINFRQPQQPSKKAPADLDDFVNLDPRIPTPSLPADPAPRTKPETAAEDLVNMTFRLSKRLKKVLKARAGLIEKPLERMLSDILEAYLDKQDPEWRNQ